MYTIFESKGEYFRVMFYMLFQSILNRLWNAIFMKGFEFIQNYFLGDNDAHNDVVNES